MVPLSGLISPEIRLIAVLLPAPLGPTSPVMLCGGTENVQPWTARTPPKLFHRSMTSRAGVTAGLATMSALARPGAAAAAPVPRSRGPQLPAHGLQFRQEACRAEPQDHDDEQPDGDSLHRRARVRVAAESRYELDQLRERDQHDHCSGHGADYNLPKKLLTPAEISAVRIYVQINNALL